MGIGDCFSCSLVKCAQRRSVAGTRRFPRPPGFPRGPDSEDLLGPGYFCEPSLDLFLCLTGRKAQAVFDSPVSNDQGFGLAEHTNWPRGRTPATQAHEGALLGWTRFCGSLSLPGSRRPGCLVAQPFMCHCIGPRELAPSASQAPSCRLHFQLSRDPY